MLKKVRTVFANAVSDSVSFLKWLAKTTAAFLIQKFHAALRKVKAWGNKFYREIQTKWVPAMQFGFGCTGRSLKALGSAFCRKDFKGAWGAFVRKAKEEFGAGQKKTIWFVTSLAVSACLVVAIGSVLFWNICTVAIEVKTGDTVVGYLTASDQCDDLKKNIKARIIPVQGAEDAVELSFSYAVVSKSSVSDIEALTDSALTAQEGITEVYGLYVDGNYITCATSEEVLRNALELRKNYYLSGNDDSAEIVNDIKILPVYYPNTVNNRHAEDTIRSATATPLQIKTIGIYTEKKTVAFKSEERKDTSKVVGYRRVSTTGKNGLAMVTERRVSINGEVVEVETLSSETIQSPVNEIIVCGTSKAGVSGTVAKLASSGKLFLWPIAPSENSYISCPFGKKNHRGIDITGKQGTAIYAGADGVVIFAGYNGNMGNTVKIDHGNGYVTVYGHMNNIKVSVGQSVSAGAIIGGCGRTGYATGNHLHFEVQVYGTCVNPAPYLGLS